MSNDLGWKRKGKMYRNWKWVETKGIKNCAEKGEVGWKDEDKKGRRNEKEIGEEKEKRGRRDAKIVNRKAKRNPKKQTYVECRHRVHRYLRLNVSPYFELHPRPKKQKFLMIK